MNFEQPGRADKGHVAVFGPIGQLWVLPTWILGAADKDQVTSLSGVRTETLPIRNNPWPSILHAKGRHQLDERSAGSWDARSRVPPPSRLTCSRLANGARNVRSSLVLLLVFQYGAISGQRIAGPGTRRDREPGRRTNWDGEHIDAMVPPRACSKLSSNNITARDWTWIGAVSTLSRSLFTESRGPWSKTLYFDFDRAPKVQPTRLFSAT